MKNILLFTKLNETYIKEIKERMDEYEVLYVQNEEEAEKYIKETEIIISFDFEFYPNIVDKASNLKWIHLLSAGADTLPFEKLKEMKVLVTNSRDVHKYQISQQVIGYLLMFERALNVFVRNQMKKLWDRSVRVSELTGKTALIIGVGSIGEEIARLLKEFGMKVYGIRSSGKPSLYVEKMYTSIEDCDVLSFADYVISILPLTKDTYHLIGENVFSRMKNTSYFINVGRGKVVDEKALINALENKVIKGAALDVFEEEPLREDSPLWDMENVIITPHMAGVTPLYMQRAMEILKENLDAYKEGRTLRNIVNLDKGY
ncbi:D-isomer specific 2-hydroxyacid dehydrogenase NAD-binding protein [Thermoanaerobacter mathranii subsp. mathranii str. A3]|uniref:D-isomer specific 2-hydroxyacid dehydrogenase NAD-binding protein n=1 Tax=Thermoanaerobacter mathranii subsp. mathranii (strain DSM 11426 / CCUG 53645 / CIP 108742 / A3) TaxID=583358 RepID=A0ABM5LNT7_THEM3|nr:D-2-hydroxyacid dehydrogenase [Thermoanaerobacter mathranii]ADH60355.1 D-isomer specific 2-hydroxyacid dehydrogenase NAD-binding protein [Thermoanaerobacter mathranii subsp. mathranii str. A3]